jgi:hypothetical protein
MRSAQLDPQIAADLDALDAALRGERDDLAVAIIADEARNAAAPMPPGLELRLEKAIADGFPKPAGSKRRRVSLLGPGLGLAGAAAVAVVIGLSSAGGGGSEDSSSSSVATREAAQSEAGDAGGSSAATAPSVAQDEAVAPDALSAPTGRRVQRAAELTLSTPLGKLQDTADEVVRTTDRLGGYVQRSDVFAGEERGRATFELRIPSDRLDDGLAQLSKLGHVQSRTQQSEDITGRFTSARARLHDARTERQALLRALAEATTTTEIDSIKQRLEIANSRIEAAKGDLFSARRAANYATVQLALVGSTGEDEEGVAGGGDDEWTPGKALGDAADVLSVAAGVLIVALAASIPAGLVLGLLALAFRAWRRRARNLALGGSAV